MTPTPANLDRAVKLLNEGCLHPHWDHLTHPTRVLARVLDEHDAFKRELSDVLRSYRYDTSHATFGKFIIPEPVDPLVEATTEWRCFHCDEAFTDRREAALHFGADEGKTPACQIKGSDRGLLRALRDAEAEADEAIQRMHDESTDAAKAYHRQRCRHTQALMAAEEAGYERGLSDGRLVADRPKPDAAEVWSRAVEAWRRMGGWDEAAIAVVAEALGQGEG